MNSVLSNHNDGTGSLACPLNLQLEKFSSDRVYLSCTNTVAEDVNGRLIKLETECVYEVQKLGVSRGFIIVDLYET